MRSPRLNRSHSLIYWLRIGLLGLCVFLSACSGRVDLLGTVTEDEANDVLAALLKESIAATKIPGKDGMVGVSVSADQVGHALQVLRDNGLPRERFAGMGQVFKKEGLISSPLEERARYVYALSQELSNTISKIDGVLAARVHVVLPERGTVGEVGTPSTAAVFIKYQDGYNLEIIQPQIRRLVTNSIPGLAADRVSVIFVASQARASAGDSATALTKVLGMNVSADSAGRLTATLWGLIGFAIVSLAALCAMGWYVLQIRRGRIYQTTATPFTSGAG